MKIRPLLASLLAGSLALAPGCGAQEPSAAARTGEVAVAPGELPVLRAAPNWTLQRIDGTPMSSEELKGKVVVVDFWATWCPPCRAEIPGYVEMQKAYADQGLVIVGISMDQRGPKIVQEFAEKFGINYPLVMGDGDIAEAFGPIQAIPTTFLIDREGNIRHRKVGALERSKYEPIIRSLL